MNTETETAAEAAKIMLELLAATRVQAWAAAETARCEDALLLLQRRVALVEKIGGVE